MFLKKKKPPLIIRVPQPCVEDWGEMRPVERGRHCATCQKNLVDFSLLSDEDIIRYIQNSGGAICGRFANTQLNRELAFPIEEKHLFAISPLRKLAASLVLFYSILNHADAQQKTNPPVYHTPNRGPKTKAVQPADTSAIVIHVTVINAHSELPAKRIGFKIKGTGYQGTTNIYGKFKFVLPDSFLGKTVIITPDDSTKVFLENTGSVVPDESVIIDSIPCRKEVILYRYPADKINTVQVVGPRFTKGLIDDHAPFDPTAPILSPAPVSAPKNKTRSLSEKIKDFFKGKKKEKS